MYFGTIFWSLALLSTCSAERWRWPEESGVQARAAKTAQRAESVRIDTKVRFFDEEANNNNHHDNSVQADEVPFKVATDTEGFYNRPPGSGRYPVRVETQRAPYRDGNANSFNANGQNRPQHHSDGTLDSLQYCKCISTPECNPPTDLPNACGPGKFLCCYKRRNKHNPQKTEFFNEVEDERPNLLPGQGFLAGPFPHPPDSVIDGAFDPGNSHDVGFLSATGGRQPGVLVGPEGPTGNIGPPKRPILVGPGGPTGIIGPDRQKPGVLVGPGGPTGVIGPGPEKNHNQQAPSILVGPDGPTGEIGPSASAQRGVLVGPGDPTGIIGPAGYNRGVLVGPGRPTGIIGPGRPGYGQSTLVGPGGPTGVIGPAGYGRQTGRPGILVGPGGPTGIIGPGRQILVGPGGPTGYIGPRRSDFGN